MAGESPRAIFHADAIVEILERAAGLEASLARPAGVLWADVPEVHVLRGSVVIGWTANDSIL